MLPGPLLPSHDAPDHRRSVAKLQEVLLLTLAKRNIQRDLPIKVSFEKSVYNIYVKMFIKWLYDTNNWAQFRVAIEH